MTLMQALTAARDALSRRGQAKNVPAGTSGAGALLVVDGSSDAPTMEQQQADALALVAETRPARANSHVERRELLAPPGCRPTQRRRPG
jgi:N-acetylmuramic acid 6-phosphate (MurNAc-6-P) etherase